MIRWILLRKKKINYLICFAGNDTPNSPFRFEVNGNILFWIFLPPFSLGAERWTEEGKSLSPHHYWLKRSRWVRLIGWRDIDLKSSLYTLWYCLDLQHICLFINIFSQAKSPLTSYLPVLKGVDNITFK